MLVVFDDFTVHDAELNASLLKHLNRVGVGVVTFLADNPFDARVDYHHGACAARRHFTEQGGAFKGDSEPGGLEDGVLFGVEGSYAVLADFTVAVGDLAHVMSDFVAVGKPRWRAYVTGGHYAFVFDDDCSAFASVAGCPCSHGFTHVKEVSVPVGSMLVTLYCHLGCLKI